jgi:hypothetical protein
MPKVTPDPTAITVYPPRPTLLDPPDVKFAERKADNDEYNALLKTREGPYAPGTPFSFYRDLLTLYRADVGRQGTIDNPRYALGDPGPDPSIEPMRYAGAGAEADAARRIKRALVDKRDITSSTGSTPDLLRPSMPGRLLEIWGRAARRVSGLVDALPRIPLERGMVDNTGSQLVVRIPALTGGGAVATATENSAVTEQDPTSTGIAWPLGSIAGQVDASRQVVDFSQPSIDDVLTDDLSARLTESLDAQVLNGSGGAGTMRGFYNVSGILTVVGVVTNQSTYLNSLLQAFSQVAGASGYGSADEVNIMVAMHPRRFAWLQAGFAYPVDELLPGEVVLVPNTPTNLGGATNEDWALVIERSAVLLIGGQPVIRTFEEVGSGTQTVRFSAHADAALAVLNAKAVGRVTGGTPPSGF